MAAGESGWWESSTKSLRCTACGDFPAGAALERPLTATGVSAAGGSARREYERRVARREERIRAAHPKLGGLILAASSEPASTTAWAKGAAGEVRVGQVLDGLGDWGVVALHDRRLAARSRANIDHLAVGPSGVWVIDAKRYTGEVNTRDVGGWFRTDVRLYVGRRDCTGLVDGVGKQVAAVSAALSAAAVGVPVRGVLCFVAGEWPLFSGPFEIDGVTVVWPRKLADLIAKPGPASPETVTAVASRLAQQFPPALWES